MRRVKTVRGGLNTLANEHMDSSPAPIISSQSDDDNDTLQTATQTVDANESQEQKVARQRHIEQLVQSEATYCTRLQQFIRFFTEPLSHHLSSQHHYILFGDLHQIYSQNAQFSIVLEQQFKNYDANCNTTILSEAISKFFQSNVQILYQNYVNRYDEARKLLATLQTDSKFLKFLDDAHAQMLKETHDPDNAYVDPASAMNTLRQLLVLPMHRISQYALALQAIVDATPVSHVDCDALRDCLRTLQSVQQLIDDTMNEFAERETVRKIALAVKGSHGLKLETPYRRFIKNGYLMKMGKNKAQRYLFFLFNDLLFYAKREGPMAPLSTATATATSTSAVAHDYSDTSTDLQAVVGDAHALHRSRVPKNTASRKSQTKLSMDNPAAGGGGAGEDKARDIHNEIDVYHSTQLPHIKIHNLMPIDGAFDVTDFRLHPQLYERCAFEIRSSVKSFIVVAETERSKKEWMSLLQYCCHHQLQPQNINALTRTRASSASSSTGVDTRKFAATLYLPLNFTEQCMKCTKPFGYKRRKNHCHHCGYLVCSKCLAAKLPPFETLQQQHDAAAKSSSKNHQPCKVCGDCYNKHKHFFPDFEEASALSTNAKSKIFAYKQKSKRKQQKKNHKKMKIFTAGDGKASNNLAEDVENDVFYERGSLKDGTGKHTVTISDSGSEEDGTMHLVEDDEEDDAFGDDEESRNVSYMAMDDVTGGEERDTDREIEPSMHSIPEHDAYEHMDALIAPSDGDREPSQLLAPHWMPATSGHNNREFSYNLNESGYADNDDSDSDPLQAFDSDEFADDAELQKPQMTPPASPFYDDVDAPLSMSMSMDGSSAAGSGHTKGVHVEVLKMRPQNSLNMGDTLDAIEAELMEQDGKTLSEIVAETNAANESKHDSHDMNEDELLSPLLSPQERPSVLLGCIPENEDSMDSSSAGEYDEDTVNRHIRNLSSHIEDQMTSSSWSMLQHVDEESDQLQINVRDVMRTSASSPNLASSSPGHTPPPISPRFKPKSRSRESQTHKRKLSDKLDTFLNVRQNPQQLVQKHILYATPEHDIESVKQQIAQKREERDKIKKRLKRKLSHDFRPTEQDIEERGIRLMPNVIRSDEEDEEEEIVVYDMRNGRKSFSLHKKRSFEEEQKSAAASASRVESADIAAMLHEGRKRNSKKLEKALDQRPTPTEMIEFGYISAQSVNEFIPVTSDDDGLQRLHAELNRLCNISDWYRIQNEKLRVKKQRRRQLLSFYDRFLFNSMVNDDDGNEEDAALNVDDYASMCSLIQSEQQDHALFSRPDVVADLSGIPEQDQQAETEWMRNLRARKFKTYLCQQKGEKLQNKNEEMRRRLSELIEQIEIVQSTHRIESLSKEVETLREQKCVLLQNTCQQIDHLRNVIKRLHDSNIHVVH